MIFSRRHFLGTAAATGATLTLGPHDFPFARLRDSGERVPIDQIAADPLRPQFHLMPSRNWMNDPNGPIYWKNNYHMFFQYNPDAAVWGNMHWAHAVSPDMIHWKHMPIALAPSFGGYDQDGCFSGSAVNNNGIATIFYTGVKTVPGERATLRDGTHNFQEVQCLATSADADLQTWQKIRNRFFYRRRIRASLDFAILSCIARKPIGSWEWVRAFVVWVDACCCIVRTICATGGMCIP